jgi:hypothetical protein
MITDVMETLTAKGSAKADATVAAPVPSSGSTYEEAVVLLAGALANMQVLLTQILKGKAKDDAQLAKEQVAGLEANIKVVANLIQQQIDAQQHEDFWQKVAAVFMMVIGAVLCAVGMPELGAVMLVLGILQISGAMDKITHAIVHSLVENCGMSEKAATILADALIVVVVTLASMGVGGIAGSFDAVATDVVDNALDDGIEMTNLAPEVAENGASEGANAVKQGASIAARMKNGAVAGFFQSTLGTNLATNIIDAIPFPDTSGWQIAKEVIEAAVMIALMVASVAAPGGGLDALSKLPSSVAANFGRVAYVSQLGAGAATIAKGSYGIDAGIIQGELAAPQSISEMIETTLSRTDETAKATQKFMALVEQTVRSDLSLMSQMFVGQEKVAQMMASA